MPPRRPGVPDLLGRAAYRRGLGAVHQPRLQHIDPGSGEPVRGIDNLLLASETTTTNLRLYTFGGSTMGYIEAVGVIKDGSGCTLRRPSTTPTSDGRGAATLYINGEIKARGQVPWLGRQPPEVLPGSLELVLVLQAPARPLVRGSHLEPQPHRPRSAP